MANFYKNKGIDESLFKIAKVSGSKNDIQRVETIKI
jgi:hypothetical protein